MTDPTSERAFTDYTTADHARVAWAAACLTMVQKGRDYLLPRDQAGSYARPEIHLARQLRWSADKLADLAVIVAHEDGASWADIGGALGVARQTAHERYAPAVQTFRAELGSAIQRAREGLAPLDRGTDSPAPLYVVDTPAWAAMADELAATDLPSMLNPPRDPGAFLATLSNPGSYPGRLTGDVRACDDPRPVQPQCPYRAAGSWAGTVVVCTLPNGHAGDHQFAAYEPVE